MMTWKLTQSHGELMHSDWLAAQPAITHGFTVKTTPDDNRHFSFGVTDDWTAVRDNRRRACTLLDTDISHLIVPAQSHGANVGVVGRQQAGRGAFSPETAIPDCDALITTTPGIVLGITVADCLPIYLYDPVGNVIGLAHSGWRGTAGSIAVNTLAHMMTWGGTQPHNVLAAIGPGISASGYEVDAAVYDAFGANGVRFAGTFTPSRTGHWFLDLAYSVRRQLEACGVPSGNIDICELHTDTHPHLLHSHRRVPNCPRMMALLGLKE
jgi:polyphenol oxidase